MIAFFNTQNKNKLVKEASKLFLPPIPVNQKIFVPMIAKVFDMEESNKYDLSYDDTIPEIIDL
jgi:hypothetical protein